MTLELKLRRVGNSLGIVLPKEAKVIVAKIRLALYQRDPATALALLSSNCFPTFATARSSLSVIMATVSFTSALPRRSFETRADRARGAR